MKLLLFSGGTLTENKNLDRDLWNLSEKKNPSITYIPSGCGHGEESFQYFSKHFKNFGFSSLFYFPVDIPFTKQALQKAIKRDIIYLSGGNTFYFLKHLRRSGMISELKKFVKAGGILSGQSAGGILMTQNIATASFPRFDCDPNDVELKNLSALNLVPFEFFPHFSNNARYIKEIKKYTRSKNCSRSVLACEDGGGIIINGNYRSFFGKCYLFQKGYMFNLFYTSGNRIVFK